MTNAPEEYAAAEAAAAVGAVIGRKPQPGRIYRKSVDARRRDAIKFVYTASAIGDFTASELERLSAAGIAPLEEGEPEEPHPGSEPLSGRPVIIGFGPAGMFCALALARRGYRPLVLERGYDVEERAAAVERFSSGGELDPECNVQFGAGGAGTFSDGKLVTRINDKLVRHVLHTFHRFGAPEVCRARGGEPVTIECGAVVVAAGHSARDVYHYLAGEGFSLETKPFSVGARIEHLREDVDRALYGRHAGDPRLGAAEYAYSKRWPDGSAVYTFCMCPGGEVIAAASEPGGVVVNGMSRSARDGVNSNAALVASVDPAPGSPLLAVEYQRQIERAAYLAGASGGEYFAPCQSVGDFIEKRSGKNPSRVLPTYRGGRVVLANLWDILPRDVCERMRAGIAEFGKKSRFFGMREALLTGVETRTSAPVRILRGEGFTAPGHGNVYPCGEGAGYAGGITSAAVDGLRGPWNEP